MWEGYMIYLYPQLIRVYFRVWTIQVSWSHDHHHDTPTDRRKCQISQSESCTERYWPMRRQEMHSEGSISVIGISVSTALWFPTSAPPSPLTSETNKKCVITISYLSQQWSSLIIDLESLKFSVLPVITLISPGHNATQGGGDPLVAAVVNGLTGPGKLLDSLPATAVQLKIKYVSSMSSLILAHAPRTCLWMIFLLSWLTSFQPKCRTSPICKKIIVVA